MFVASSADDMCYSDLVLIWGGNPVYTQIPNAHFIYEARYKGATIVSIAPDFNASSIHADLWVPVEPGTDAALGLAMAQVMIAENLHDEGFIREQTDFPLLVRKDTRRFLREADLESGGAEDVFYLFDRTSGEIREAPKWTLDLEELDPALEGEYEVQTVDGEVAVEPVFALFRRHVAAYTPEAVSEITGTSPDLIRDLARRIARAKAAAVLTQANFSQVLSRPRDGASSDPGDDAGRSVREEGQRLRRLPDAQSRQASSRSSWRPAACLRCSG